MAGSWWCRWNVKVKSNILGFLITKQIFTSLCNWEWYWIIVEYCCPNIDGPGKNIIRVGHISTYQHERNERKLKRIVDSMSVIYLSSQRLQIHMVISSWYPFWNIRKLDLLHEWSEQIKKFYLTGIWCWHSWTQYWSAKDLSTCSLVQAKDLSTCLLVPAKDLSIFCQ